MKKRLSEGVKKLYLDGSRRPEMTGNPEALWPIAGEKTLWRRSVEQAFPEAEIGSIRSVTQEMRWAKSPAEVAILREVARTTAAALLDRILKQA